MVVYLDDGIGAAQGQLKTEQDALAIQGDLLKAGFVTNLSKCKWSLSQQCTWPGFDIDLIYLIIKLYGAFITPKVCWQHVPTAKVYNYYLLNYVPT